MNRYLCLRNSKLLFQRNLFQSFLITIFFKGLHFQVGFRQQCVTFLARPTHANTLISQVCPAVLGDCTSQQWISFSEAWEQWKNRSFPVQLKNLYGRQSSVRTVQSVHACVQWPCVQITMWMLPQFSGSTFCDLLKEGTWVWGHSKVLFSVQQREQMEGFCSLTTR